MADLTHYDLMKIVGQQMAEYICSEDYSNNWFRKDLINENGNDQLVTYSGDIKRIQKQMSDPDWLDGFQA